MRPPGTTRLAACSSHSCRSALVLACANVRMRCQARLQTLNNIPVNATGKVHTATAHIPLSTAATAFAELRGTRSDPCAPFCAFC
jgi:hypothetical protein